jgi:hypothetical protein
MLKVQGLRPEAEGAKDLNPGFNRGCLPRKNAP